MLKDFVDWFNNGTYHYAEQTAEGLALASIHGAATKASFIDKLIQPKNRTHIGISDLGKPAVLVALNKLGFPGETLKVNNIFNFHYGDWIESFFISLMKSYGLSVTDEQKVVNFGDCIGHIDCLVSNQLVEIKSLSDNNFRRMRNGELDIYGYSTQLSCYSQSLGLVGGWLIFNKATRELALVELDGETYTRCVDRAHDVLEGLKNISDTEDIFKYFEAPPPVNEVYQKKETSNLLLPESMRYSEYSSCFYELEIRRNGYYKDTVYVKDFRNEVDIIYALNQKRRGN